MTSKEKIGVGFLMTILVSLLAAVTFVIVV